MSASIKGRFLMQTFPCYLVLYAPNGNVLATGDQVTGLHRVVMRRHISFEVRAGRVAALLRSATRVPLLEIGAADIKLGLGTQVSADTFCQKVVMYLEDGTADTPVWLFQCQVPAETSAGQVFLAHTTW
jgi:hypothetical protein